MKIALGFSAFFFMMLSMGDVNAKNESRKYLLYVGTYTKGDSKGIYAYRYDAASGELTSLGLAAETPNPSFVAADPSGRVLYAVNELSDYKGAASGARTAFFIYRPSRQLSQLQQISSRSPHP